MEFNEAMCKVLHLVWPNPKHKHRLVDEWIESRPEENDLGVLDAKQYESAMNVCSPEFQLHLGLQEKKYGQQVEGRTFTPLL